MHSTSKHTCFLSPFGMVMVNRSGGNYRYGFQNQEVDDEVKGNGNSVNYKFRMHDPRVGRFFAVDPLAYEYPHNSPYAFSENVVMSHIELEGLEKSNIKAAKRRTHMRVKKDFSGVGWLGKLLGIRKGKYFKHTLWPNSQKSSGTGKNSSIHSGDEIVTTDNTGIGRKEIDETEQTENSKTETKISDKSDREEKIQTKEFYIPFVVSSDAISNEDAIEAMKEFLGDGENTILDIEVVTSTLDPRKQKSGHANQQFGIIVQGRVVGTENSKDLLIARKNVLNKYIDRPFKHKKKYSAPSTETKVIVTYKEKKQDD